MSFEDAYKSDLEYYFLLAQYSKKYYILREEQYIIISVLMMANAESFFSIIFMVLMHFVYFSHSHYAIEADDFNYE